LVRFRVSMITSGVVFITRVPYLTMDHREWLCAENPDEAGRPDQCSECMG
jgi:hypothetical protein